MKFQVQLSCALLLIYPLALASLGVLANDQATTANSASTEQATAINESSAADRATSSQQQVRNSGLSKGRLAEDEPISESRKPSSAGAPGETTTAVAAAEGLEDDQATSPTMTSVHHQVWTSSSSGSLDELSPELISKLRGDVPFLAAYALRPRLVGAASSSRLEEVPNMQVSASQRQQQSKPISPLVAGPKLSDFTELNVETSSTSKSEHHHKRKTTLKKQPTSIGGENSSKRRRLILAATSKLMIERRRKNKAKKLARSSSSQHKSGNRPKPKSLAKKSGRLQSQANKLRVKMGRNNRRHHMSIIRHGRQQQQPISPAVNKPPESKTNTKEADDDGGDDGGVKGGSKKSAAGVEPFYKRRKLEPTASRAGEEPAVATNDLDADDGRSNESPTEREANDDKADEDGAGDGDGDGDQDQLEPPEPRRVGDPDVDEVEGDTVTVMPKFDGVDDDPEIPIEDSEAPGGAESPSRGSQEDVEPRGRRVHREKSEPAQGNDAMVTGGGIGATTGSGGGQDEETSSPAGPPTKPGVEFADKDQGEDDRAAGDDDAKESGRSGAEKDEDESGEDDDGRGGESMGERPFDSRRVAANDGAKSPASDQDQAKENRDSNGSGMERDRGDGKVHDDEDDSRADDVDYRDEMEANNRSGGGKGHEDAGRGSSRPEQDARKQPGGGHHGADKDGHTDKDREGKGDHHHKHQVDCNHESHHDHHDGIKWLQDAVPGEPGEDYPTLNRVNLTNFNCRDHKYAGYYADVEARCQVFHICQADGRQDSFLCPNGTIFSQISRVCVWWNSFDCEDAPKFYALNAQLYSNSNNKQATSRSSAPDLRPLDGARIDPSDGTVLANSDDSQADDERSSIDTLIRAMRRRQMRMGSTDDGAGSLAGAMAAPHDEDEGPNGARIEGVMMDQPRRGTAQAAERDGGLSPEDEASIQRKSTKLAPADEEEDDEKAGASNGAASSRLSRNVEPRRKRRASVRQAPPKLKSRRVSRNSRRRKLRHGIKPKRRA